MIPTPPPAPAPHGPLSRWLTHPGATQRQWLHRLAHGLNHIAHHLLLPAAALVAAIVVLWLLREAAQRRWIRQGQWVEIRPSDQPSPLGGTALWRQLAPLLTARRSWLGRRPPVAFECLATHAGTRLGLWVSPTVSAVAVGHLVETAWPGSQATPTAAPALLATGARSSGARTRLGSAEWFPLARPQPNTTVDDPLRGVLNALTSLPVGGSAAFQVLARPAAGRRLQRARKAARATRAGTQATTFDLRELVSLPQSRTRSATTGLLDPLALVEVRDITGKLTDPPHFQVAIRYAATGGTGRADRRQRRRQLREISAGLGLYTARNRITARTSLRPRAVLGRRRLGRGFLLGASELAGLAHLPTEPSRYGITTAPARSVAPPAELTDA